ncbi:MAG: hypothetical protein VYE40_10370 [Myxococcota bacterium]|nr:hypothetical protein [Myxococcota bacterium]MEC9441497.1 hypothetical protein [Myxococcota bacterium]
MEARRTLDNESQASIEGGLSLSREKLLALEPGLRGWRGKLFDMRLSLGSGQKLTAIDVFSEHLRFGDVGPAIVASVEPLRVAAYANELDAIVMLSFPLALAQDLSEGDRLIAVCTYAPMQGEGYARDLIPGPKSSGQFSNAAPLIADFLSEDVHKLDAHRRFGVLEEEWEHVAKLAAQYREYFGERARNGLPIATCFS